MEIILSYIIAFIIILLFLALPIAGVVSYFLLIRKMRKEQISHIPRKSLFALFLIYGTLLMEIILGILGVWSGMSMLGVLFLLFIAPIICSIIIRRHRNNIKIPSFYAPHVNGVFIR